MPDTPQTYSAPATIYRNEAGQPTFDVTETVLLVAGAATSYEEAQKLGLDKLDFNAHWASVTAAKVVPPATEPPIAEPPVTDPGEPGQDMTAPDAMPGL